MPKVTKGQLADGKKKLNDKTEETKSFLKTVNKLDEKSLSLANQLKLVLLRNQTTFKEKLENFRDNQKDEVETVDQLDDYDEVYYDGEDTLSVLELVIIGYEEKTEKQLEKEEKLRIEQLEIQQREKDKELQMRQRQKEKQLEMEIKKEKLRTEKRIQLVGLNLERMKLEIDAKNKAHELDAELAIKKTQTEVDTTGTGKRKSETNEASKNSSRLPKLELIIFNGNILKWQEFLGFIRSNDTYISCTTVSR